MNFRIKRAIKKSHSLRFLSWLGYLNFVDLLSMALPVKRVPKLKRRVVFARLDGLGDYTIWSETFDALAKMYPPAEFERVLVMDERWKALAEHEEMFDRKIFLNASKLVLDGAYRFRWMRSIRQLDADIIINPKLTRDFLWGDSVVRCSGAPERVGCEGFDNRMTKLQERISSGWYTRLAPAPGKADHEFESNFRFLEFLASGKSFKPEMRLARTNSGKSDRSFGIKGDYALFFLGAQTADRRWPTEKYAQAANFVTSEYGLQIVLSAGPGEERLADDFGAAYPGKFVTLIGKTSLLDLNGLIETAKLVLTNDTGAAHIATISKRPTVVVTPGNQVGRFFPYPPGLQRSGVRQLSVFHEMPCFGCGWNCIYTNLGPTDAKPCIANVEVNDVIGAIRALMTEPSANGRDRTRI
jgi:ADP-heptose:LPS heptosyltransferase